jgi:hypothetical protein
MKLFRIEVAAILITLGVVIALLFPAVQNAREAARKSVSKNNLKQLGLAFHNYYDTHMQFPPGAVVNEQDVAYHGWFSFLLPFLDSSPVYNWIDFNLSWDHPINEKAFRQDYRTARILGESQLATESNYCLLHYMANPHIEFRNSGLKFDEFPQGLSHSWLLGEVPGNFQPWAYTFNWRPLVSELNTGPESYGRYSEDGAHFLMADGSVKFLSNDVETSMLNQWRNSVPPPPKQRLRKPSRKFHYTTRLPPQPNWPPKFDHIDPKFDY